MSTIHEELELLRRIPIQPRRSLASIPFALAARYRIEQPMPETRMRQVRELRNDWVVVTFPDLYPEVMPRRKADRIGVPAEYRRPYWTDLTLEEVYEVVERQAMSGRDRPADGRRSQIPPWWPLSD